jgi:hypothetical protein
LMVTQGEVTLEGTVEDRWMKRMAEDLVEDCSGVKQVHNRLRIKGREEGGGRSGIGAMGLDTGLSGSESRSTTGGGGSSASMTQGASGSSGLSGTSGSAQSSGTTQGSGGATGAGSAGGQQGEKGSGRGPKS